MRLTEKCNSNLFGYTIDMKSELFVVRKLGQLEDIEEELGIDLLDYLKQIVDGIKQIKENSINPNGVIVCIKGATYKIKKEELK